MGNLICVSGETGEVYFWDHEMTGHAHRSLNVRFGAFIERLRTEDELLDDS